MNILSPISNLVKEFASPPQPKAEQKTIDVIRALSEAVVSVTQDISQGVFTVQSIGIDCSKKTAGESCLLCMDTMKKVGYTDLETKKLCKPTCECIIEDVDMSKIINVNMEALFTSVSEQDFFNQFKNSIVSQTNQSGSTNYLSNTEINSLTTSVTNVFTSMKSSDFKAKIDGIYSLQMIQLKGAGTIKNITIQSTIDYVSKCIMSSSIIMSQVSDIQKEIIQMSSQITRNFILALVDMLVAIFFIIFIILFLWFIIHFGFTVLSLKRSTDSIVKIEKMKNAV